MVPKLWSEGIEVVVVRLYGKKSVAKVVSNAFNAIYFDKEKRVFALRGNLPWNFRFFYFSNSGKIKDP